MLRFEAHSNVEIKNATVTAVRELFPVSMWVKAWTHQENVKCFSATRMKTKTDGRIGRHRIR